MRSLGVVGLLAGSLWTPGCGQVEDLANLTMREAITGSGKVVTRPYELADFDAVNVQGPFAVEIQHADSFGVRITADDNLFEHMRVSKVGHELRIALDPGRSFRVHSRMKASVMLPRLEAVRFAGAVEGTMAGFPASERFTADSSGASRLKGTIETGRLHLEASGASTISLAGTAKEARLEASGASRLDLGKLKLGRADVELAGASHATLYVHEALDYSATGASRVIYEGNPKVGKQDTSGASSVVHR